MAAPKVKVAGKQNDKNIDTLTSKVGTASQEKEQANPQSTEIRMTFRCSKDLIDRLDKMRKGRAGRLSRNQAMIEILDSRLPR